MASARACASISESIGNGPGIRTVGNFTGKELTMLNGNVLSVLAMSALIAVTLSGCGSSGGGAGGGGGPVVEPMPDLRSVLDDANSATIADVIGRAADAQPAAGSVTQSANVDANGVTADRLEVEARYDETNVICFTVENGTEWTIAMDEGDPQALTGLPSPWRGANLVKRTDDGTVLVIAYSDIGHSDTDYLAGGFWLFFPDDLAHTQGYAGGAFADGNDPFRQENILALQGSATYSGWAAGTYTLRSLSGFDLDVFFGVANLTADFGADNGLGTVSGSITEVEVDGELIGATLDLGTAAIGSDKSGFFEGQATGFAGALTLQGRWGGQFYGNGESNGLPSSVAGTFGGRSVDNTANFIGTFGAHHQ